MKDNQTEEMSLDDVLEVKVFTGGVDKPIALWFKLEDMDGFSFSIKTAENIIETLQEAIKVARSMEN